MGILERLASEGGYVFAVYRGIRGAKIGFVKPEAGITLYRGRWRTRPDAYSDERDRSFRGS
jgi:hypothetical protein